MRILRDYLYLEPADRGAVAAIGNFDGVHLGHQRILAQAQEIARELGAPSGVLTFEPHPREVFAPEAPPFRLMNAEARAHRLEKLGIERLYELTFSAGLAERSAENFAEIILAERLGLSHAIVGADFHFGKGRDGDAAALEAFGRRFGFGVTIAPLVTLPEGRISSTAIRDGLSEGRPREAARMLGHWHRLEGTVIRGDQRGRDLGFPTANISIDGLHPPRHGIYAVLADVLDGPHRGSYRGAASIGTRPTFGVNHPNCETFLFDFTGDLYGSQLSVALVEYLRAEERYDGVEALMEQIAKDCANARARLADV